MDVRRCSWGPPAVAGQVPVEVTEPELFTLRAPWPPGPGCSGASALTRMWGQGAGFPETPALYHLEITEGNPKLGPMVSVRQMGKQQPHSLPSGVKFLGKGRGVATSEV